ncbi:MAG: hypothetical protein ACFFD8_03725 [Candidatus Thorarchaeota archaeon]
MSTIMKGLRCSHCDGPLEYKAGDHIVTCPYCGTTQVVDVSKPFLIEHFMLPLKLEPGDVEAVLRSWMRKGRLKSPELHKKAKMIEAQLRYLPFWLIEITAMTKWTGIFERVTPAITKSNTMKKTYHWLILARRRAGFPTKEFDLPTGATQPYDFRDIPEYAEVINSQLTRDEALSQAQQEVEEHHRYLLSQDVDQILEFETKFSVGEVQYVHAPIYYARYLYKRKHYTALIGGHRKLIIAAEFPTT